MRLELERVPIPGEREARARTWSVLARAFHERRPSPRRSPWLRVAVVATAVALVGAAALSSPGRAVLDEVREVVGVERAQPALFSLPAPGRMLVSSDAGVWVVSEDGSKRLLGRYREASWSPFGRFVVAARENELVALEPDGDVRWTLARPSVRAPRWAGTETDTRIAYVDRTGLRIVAGDGTGDRLLVRGFRGLLAWNPRSPFLLAVATRGAIRLIDVRTGRARWERDAPRGRLTTLAWSASGRRLLVASTRGIHVYDARGTRPLEIGPGTAPIHRAALSPSGGKLVFAARSADQTQVWIVPRIRPGANAARRLFAGRGQLEPAAWAPGGRWAVVVWRDADQWLFLRANGSGIRAVSNIAEQFDSKAVPRVEGWCCAPTR